MLHILTCIPWLLRLFQDNINQQMICLWQANIDLIVFFLSLSLSSPASISIQLTEKNPRLPLILLVFFCSDLFYSRMSLKRNQPRSQSRALSLSCVCVFLLPVYYHNIKCELFFFLLPLLLLGLSVYTAWCLLFLLITSPTSDHWYSDNK